MEAVGKLLQHTICATKTHHAITHIAFMCGISLARRSFDEPVWHCWQLRKHKLSNLSFTAWTHIHYSLLPALPPHSERKFSVRHFTLSAGLQSSHARTAAGLQLSWAMIKRTLAH
jgi:hypothetical protein